MIDLQINGLTKNMVITNRDFVLTPTLSEYVAQKLKLHLSIFKGEWYLNNTIGIPYFQEIFVKNPNLSRIEDIFKREIISIMGVDSIQSFILNYDNNTRELAVTFTALLTNSELLTVTI